MQYNNVYVDYINNIIQNDTQTKELFDKNDTKRLSLVFDKIPGNYYRQCLISRMIFRKGPWIRTDKLLHCVPIPVEGDYIADDVIEEALSSLASSDLIEYLGIQSSVEEGIAAMSCSLSVSELKVLYKKTSRVASSIKSRDEMLDQIVQVIKTSRDVFGNPLNWYRLLQESLQSRLTYKTRIVRVKPDVLHLIRRMERLSQIHTTDLLSSHPSQSLSVHSPLSFKAALLVTFNKILFPVYKLSTAPIFPSSAEFSKWEAAVELKSVWFELSETRKRLAKGQCNRLLSVFRDRYFTRIDRAVSVFDCREDAGNRVPSLCLDSILKQLLTRDFQSLPHLSIGTSEGRVPIADLEIGERMAFIAAACLTNYVQAAGNRRAAFDIFEAGCVLVSMCRMGVRLLEQRGSAVGFGLAVVLIRTVLATPYPRSRLKWLDRLVIDLTHLHRWLRDAPLTPATGTD